MMFQGFRSISEYERECEKHGGYVTKRIPFHRGNEKFFVLITGLRHPSPSSVQCWDLFTEDESALLLEGVLDGCYSNYLGKLAARGFFPDTVDDPMAV